MKESNAPNKNLLYGFVIGLICLVLGYYLGAKGLNKLAQNSQEIYLQEAAQQSAQKQEEYFNAIEEDMPQNPTQATARCASTGAVITSGEATTCPDPVFSWTGAGSESETAQSYLVYWFESTDPPPQAIVTDNSVVYNEAKPPILVEAAEFKPWPSDLELGKTYHLMVQTQIEGRGSLAQTGGEVVDEGNNIIQKADVLFVYNYTN